MIHEKFSFTWSSFARASALTPELAKLMKQSGCEFVDLGLESGSQKILDNMDKRLSRTQSFDAIRLLNDNGIISRGSFIIGYPGETRDTFLETVDFINESGLPLLSALPLLLHRKHPGARGPGGAEPEGSRFGVGSRDHGFGGSVPSFDADD